MTTVMLKMDAHFQSNGGFTSFIFFQQLMRTLPLLRQKSNDIGGMIAALLERDLHNVCYPFTPPQQTNENELFSSEVRHRSWVSSYLIYNMLASQML